MPYALPSSGPKDSVSISSNHSHVCVKAATGVVAIEKLPVVTFWATEQEDNIIDKRTIESI